MNPARSLGTVLETRALVLSAAVLAPTAAVASITGQPQWGRALVVAVSALIAAERSGLAPLGVVLHGAAICAGIACLAAALADPPLFVVATAILAGGSVLLTARGAKLRSLGSFTFIPALYVACELAEGAAPDRLAGLGVRFVPYAAAAILPVLVLSAARHHAARAEGVRYPRHAVRVMRWTQHGEPLRALEAAWAAVLGVASAAALVEWQHLPHGQWVIWSAVSVIAGEAAAVHRKVLDRAVGALVGVPLGLGAGLLLPPYPAMVDVVTLAGLLTLVAFRSYRLAFGLRCACVALALMLSEHSGLVAAERTGNVLLGGLLGLSAFALVHALTTILPRPASRTRGGS